MQDGEFKHQDVTSSLACSFTFFSRTGHWAADSNQGSVRNRQLVYEYTSENLSSRTSSDAAAQVKIAQPLLRRISRHFGFRKRAVILEPNILVSRKE